MSSLTSKCTTTMVHNSLHNRDRVKQQPPLVTAIVVRRKFEPLVSIQRVVGLLLCELDKEVGTGAGFLPRSGDLAGKIDRYFARCDSACSTSDTEIARLRALRRRRGRPAPINSAHRRRRAWELGWRPTELERGTRDDPIVLDPPGKFQCIVEAAVF